MSDTEYRRHQTASQLAALTLANAFIFQAELADQDARVKPLRRLLDQDDPVNALLDHWKFICEEINYVPIFYLARQILLDSPPREEMYRALRRLGDKVHDIVAQRAALRHDLMGRIYHLLLLEAKYLGTYYTSVPAATLLLKLALEPDRWEQVAWDDIHSIARLRIADLACGTGTLLMAAQQTITDNFVRATTSAGNKVEASDLRQLHAHLMEDVLHGYDVLSSAVHLTASTLALLAPEISFETTNLVCLPLGVFGGGTTSLGSIEFLHEVGGSPPQIPLIREGGDEGDEEGFQRLGSAGSEVPVAVSGHGGEETGKGLPRLDLCVMNPPFTRSVGGNLLFGSLPTDQRKKLQDKLKTLLARDQGPRILASSTAGLGSVFVAVAHVYMKSGGRMALVLPAALGFGAAWEKTRRLFDQDYVLEYVVSSHDPNQWNFSENTDLSEVLVVARRRRESSEQGHSTFVNLWRNPGSPIEALALAELIRRKEPSTLFDEDGSPRHSVTELVIGDRKYGETISVPWARLKGLQWYPGAFAQTDLVRTAHYLRDGQIYISGEGVVGTLPLTALENIGSIGPDRRDIYDGFNRAASKTAYPAFWGHDATEVTSIGMEPNSYLAPLQQAKKGRPLRDVEVLWPRSGRVMIAERMWLLTQRLFAVRLPERALSNVWWPFHLHEEDERAEKALVLWLNSGLGIVNTLAHRVPTRGPWIDFKKPFLRALRVLDVDALSSKQLDRASAFFDSIGTESLLSLSEYEQDETRQLIDKAIAEILDIERAPVFHTSLGREPIVANLALDEVVEEAEEQPEFAF